MTFEDKLKSIYTYDADTGIITKGDKPTGWVCANGYVYVSTPFDKKVLAHRLAWLLHTGDWPTNDIDHINRDRKDNRICNLRVLTRSQNLLKTAKKKADSEGISLWEYCSSDDIY